MKTIVLVLLIGLGAVTLGLFLISGCENKVKSEIKSPDGKHIATLFERDCGATTDFSTIVNLRNSSANFRGDDLGVVVVKGLHELVMVWESDTKLQVECRDCRTEDIFNEEKSWHGIDITFVH